MISRHDVGWSRPSGSVYNELLSYAMDDDGCSLKFIAGTPYQSIKWNCESSIRALMKMEPFASEVQEMSEQGYPCNLGDAENKAFREHCGLVCGNEEVTHVFLPAKEDTEDSFYTESADSPPEIAVNARAVRGRSREVRDPLSHH